SPTFPCRTPISRNARSGRYRIVSRSGALHSIGLSHCDLRVNKARPEEVKPTIPGDPRRFRAVLRVSTCRTGDIHSSGSEVRRAVRKIEEPAVGVLDVGSFSARLVVVP